MKAGLAVTVCEKKNKHGKSLILLDRASVCV